MSTHSHSTWDWSDTVTDELIDEIVTVIKGLDKDLPEHFPLLSEVDNIAVLIRLTMNTGVGVELTIAATVRKHQDKARTIVDKVMEKLDK